MTSLIPNSKAVRLFPLGIWLALFWLGWPAKGAEASAFTDFTAMPPPEYDHVALQNHYQGRGVFQIDYKNGAITEVTLVKSTGNSFLDIRSISWIKTHFRLKQGVSGAALLPLTWKITPASNSPNSVSQTETEVTPSTPSSVYEKSIHQLLDATWNKRVRSNREDYATGETVIALSLNRHGIPSDLNIVYNTSNQSFAQMCLEVVSEMHFPSPPEPMMKNGLFKTQYRFILALP
ncbi:MAG: hypothetical protein QM796_09515 [Chthoniobacteraceae bacterium]